MQNVEESRLSSLTRTDNFVEDIESLQTRWREVVLRRAVTCAAKKKCSSCGGDYGLFPWPWMASFDRGEHVVTVITMSGSCNQCGEKLLLKFPVYDYEYS